MDAHSEPHTARRYQDGCRCPTCKARKSEETRAYYASHREEALARRRAYYRANRELMLARNRAKWQANADRYRAQQRQYREQNKAHYKVLKRNSYLRTRYGLTLAELEQLLRQQSGRCAICATEISSRTLHIDHDHACCPGRKSCGKCIRGLLCSHCNQALGVIESKAFIAPALAYLGLRLMARD